MSIAAKSRQTDLELFEPRPDLVYSIESVEHITRLSRRRIALYYKYGFISPVVNPDCGGYYFNDEAIRTLRTIEHLRVNHGINLAGIRIILELVNQIERLKVGVRSQPEMLQ